MCIDLLKSEDIYLKSGKVIKNASIEKIVPDPEHDTDSLCYYFGNGILNKISTSAIARVDPVPYSPFERTRTLTYERTDTLDQAPIASAPLQEPTIPIDSLSAPSIPSTAKTADNLTEVTTYSGDIIVGELTASTDSTVTYKTRYGSVILEKKAIQSVRRTTPAAGESGPLRTNGIDLSQLTQAQRLDYDRRKLSIEVEGMGTTVGSSSPFLGSSISAYETRNWNRWTAYEGFTKMTEEQFFVRCGYRKEALSASEYASLNKSTMTYGFFLALGGAVLNFIGWTNKESETVLGVEVEVSKPSYALIGAGAVSAGIGTMMMLNASSNMKTNWAPYSTVAGMAEEYNRKLLNGYKQ